MRTLLSRAYIVCVIQSRLFGPTKAPPTVSSIDLWLVRGMPALRMAVVQKRRQQRPSTRAGLWRIPPPPSNSVTSVTVA